MFESAIDKKTFLAQSNEMLWLPRDSMYQLAQMDASDGLGCWASVESHLDWMVLSVYVKKQGAQQKLSFTQSGMDVSEYEQKVYLLLTQAYAQELGDIKKPESYLIKAWQQKHAEQMQQMQVSASASWDVLYTLSDILERCRGALSGQWIENKVTLVLDIDDVLLDSLKQLHQEKVQVYAANEKGVLALNPEAKAPNAVFEQWLSDFVNEALGDKQILEKIIDRYKVEQSVK